VNPLRVPPTTEESCDEEQSHAEKDTRHTCIAQIFASEEIDHGVGLSQQQHHETGPPREQITAIDAIGARQQHHAIDDGSHAYGLRIALDQRTTGFQLLRCGELRPIDSPARVVITLYKHVDILLNL